VFWSSQPLGRRLRLAVPLRIHLRSSLFDGPVGGLPAQDCRATLGPVPPLHSGSLCAGPAEQCRHFTPGTRLGEIFEAAAAREHKPMTAPVRYSPSAIASVVDSSTIAEQWRRRCQPQQSGALGPSPQARSNPPTRALRLGGRPGPSSARRRNAEQQCFGDSWIGAGGLPIPSRAAACAIGRYAPR